MLTVKSFQLFFHWLINPVELGFITLVSEQTVVHPEEQMGTSVLCMSPSLFESSGLSQLFHFRDKSNKRSSATSAAVPSVPYSQSLADPFPFRISGKIHTNLKDNTATT